MIQCFLTFTESNAGLLYIKTNKYYGVKRFFKRTNLITIVGVYVWVVSVSKKNTYLMHFLAYVAVNITNDCLQNPHIIKAILIIFMRGSD